jgi:hypothetical protein
VPAPVVTSVATSHAVVASLTAQTPLAPAAARSTADYYRMTPHLLVRVTTVAGGQSSSPTSPTRPAAARRTTTVLVPTTAASRPRSDRASSVGQQARGAHVTHAQKAPVTPARSSQVAGRPTTATRTVSPRSTTTQPSAAGTASPSTAPSATATALPARFGDWSAKQQWRWLRGSGQDLTYAQWKAAVRQADGSVRAGTTALSGDQASWPHQAPGRDRR